MKRRHAAALAVTVPALLVLALAWSASTEVPEPADWRVYLREPPLELRPERWHETAGQPNHLLLRALHAGALALGVDFGWAAPVCIALAAACVALAIPIGALGPGAALLLGGLVFSPAYAADWLLLERARVFVPVLFAAGALRLLASGPSATRAAAALLLATAAVFTHETGALAWAALLPAVAAQARRGGWRPLPLVAGTCLLGNVALAVCYDESARAFPGLPASLLADPAGSMLLVAKLLAGAIPDVLPGTDLDAVAVATFLIVALAFGAAALVRSDEGTRARAVPWLCSALLGVGQALALAHVHAPQSVTDAVLREVAWGTWLLPAGIAGLWLHVRPGLTAAVAPGAVVALGVLALQDWQRGIGWLRAERALLRQSEALLVFAELGRQELPAVPRPAVPEASARAALRARGFLRRALPVTDRALATVARAHETHAPGRVLHADAGMVAGTVDRATSDVDLVLLLRTADGRRPELCKVAAPDLLAGSTQTPWRAELGDLDPFTEGEVLQAEAFALASRTRRLLNGTFRFRGGRFEPIEAER